MEYTAWWKQQLVTFVKEMPARHAWSPKMKGYVAQLDAMAFDEKASRDLASMVKDIHMVRESLRSKLTQNFEDLVKAKAIAIAEQCLNCKESPEKGPNMASKMQPVLHVLMLQYPEDNKTATAVNKVAEAIKGLEVQSVASKMLETCETINQLLKAEQEEVELEDVETQIGYLSEQLEVFKVTSWKPTQPMKDNLASTWNQMVKFLSELITQGELHSEHSMAMRVLDVLGALLDVGAFAGPGHTKTNETLQAMVEMHVKYHKLSPKNGMEIDEIMMQDSCYEKLKGLRRSLLKVDQALKEKQKAHGIDGVVTEALQSLESSVKMCHELCDKVYMQQETKAKENLQIKLKSLNDVAGGKAGGLKWDVAVDKSTPSKVLIEKFVSKTLIDVPATVLNSCLVDMEQALMG